MKILLLTFSLFVSSCALADAICHGKVKEITKWSSNYDRDFSFSIEGSDFITPFVELKDETFKSMVLTAYAAQKDISLRWISPDVNSCESGWNHYDELIGYITIK